MSFLLWTFLILWAALFALGFALRPPVNPGAIIRWAGWAPVAAGGALLSWLLTPLAVRRAVDVIPANEPDLTATTLERLQSHPVQFARRLPKWARWLIELKDDQILPPGRYEPGVAHLAGDWQAQSIAMLRRNPANALDTLIGVRVPLVGMQPAESGVHPDARLYGIWRASVNDEAWQVYGLIRLPGPRDLEFTIGYAVMDLFSKTGNVESPVHTARYRLPVVRLPLKDATA